jgi:hypothetical protein
VCTQYRRRYRPMPAKQPQTSDENSTEITTGLVARRSDDSANVAAVRRGRAHARGLRQRVCAALAFRAHPNTTVAPPLSNCGVDWLSHVSSRWRGKPPVCATYPAPANPTEAPFLYEHSLKWCTGTRNSPSALNVNP